MSQPRSVVGCGFPVSPRDFQSSSTVLEQSASSGSFRGIDERLAFVSIFSVLDGGDMSWLLVAEATSGHARTPAAHGQAEN